MKQSRIGNGFYKTTQSELKGNIERRKKYVFISTLVILSLYLFSLTIPVYADYGLKSTLVNPDSEEDTRFGGSIGVSSDYLFVGAYLADVGEVVEAGQVYVFNHEGEFVKSLIPEDLMEHDWFGAEICCDQDLVFIRKNQGGIDYVGAFTSVWWPGQVYVYDTSGSYKFLLEPQEFDSHGTFGLSIIALEDYILVGQPNADTEYGKGSGRVLEYDLDGNYIKSLYSPSPQAFTHFGYNMLADEEIIVVSQFAGPDIDMAMDGSVFIMNHDWELIKRLDAPPETINEFGHSMAIYGDYIYVGDNFADIDEEANAGCIYVYDKQGELVDTILSPEPDGGENFAEVIVIYDDLLFVGARQNDDETVDAGKVYIMNLDGELVSELVSPEPSYKGFFGGSLAVYGNEIYVGEVGVDKVHVFSEGYSVQETVEATETQTTTENLQNANDSSGIPGFPIYSMLLGFVVFSYLYFSRKH